MLRVTVLAGGDEEQAFECGPVLVTLGTAPGNQVVLRDPFVSRHHGQFAFTGGRWRYRDLGSRNGSSLERAGALIAVRPGEPDVMIESGDVLLVGQTRLRLEVLEGVPAADDPAVVASNNPSDPTARWEEGRVGEGALHRLERRIGLAFQPEEALGVVLDTILAEFPAATHAIILLADRTTGAPRRQVSRARGQPGDSSQQIPLSRTVLTRVLREGRSLLLRNVPAELAESQSAADAGITSSMCAPLWTGEETVGLIQVDSRVARASPAIPAAGPETAGPSFRESDLDRLGDLAGRAALAIVGWELREQEQLNRLLRDLSAMITHDLQGPLTSILGFLSLLSQEALGEDQRDYVETALGSARWLRVLIAGILDVARMERGETELDRQPLRMSEEIPPALAVVEHQLRTRKLRVEVTAPEDLPPVSADRELIRRVIVNLVANAVRFAPPESCLRITAALDSDGAGQVVSVRDEGPGIPPEHQERIFEKFFQGEKTRATERVSLGLGLAFCRLAVEAHGGRIWCESEPGRGACLSFRLPVGPG
jgi:signal transduction histidine kinase